MKRREAKALGLKTYNNGKPCKHHPDKADGCERYANHGSCVEHKKEYDQTPEIKERGKKRHQTPEAKERRKKYQQKPEVKEREKKSQKKRRETPEYRKYMKKYLREYQQTPEYREYNKKRQHTPEYRKDERKRLQTRYKTDIQFKLACCLRSRLRSAIKNGYKAGSAVRDLGCSVAQCKSHLESQFEPGMSWDNWSNKAGCWSIDHIKPLSSFDLTDRQQCLEACHYTNLRPMWHIDNIKKGNKIP